MLSSTVFGCSCADKRNLSIEEYNNLDRVFVGTVQKISDTIGYKIVIFKVNQSFKTDPHETIIKLYTGSQTPSCGIGFNKNEKWIIFADYERKNFLYSSHCYRTQPFTKDSTTEKLLVRLLQMAKPKIGIINKSDCNVSSSFIRVYSDELCILSNGLFIKNRPEGKWEYKVIEQNDPQIFDYYNAFYLNGLKSGTWEIYNDGKLSKIINYKNGYLDGEMIIYGERGEIKRLECFKDGNEIE